MRHNQFILCSLFTAYLLMFAHAVIPHHHHSSKGEADYHHQTEHVAHHHDHESGKGHGHTSHSVHSPDFGNYIITPPSRLTEISAFQTDLIFFAPTTYNFSYQDFVTERDWLPDLPPPYSVYTPLPNGLRGSPAFISQA